MGRKNYHLLLADTRFLTGPKDFAAAAIEFKEIHTANVQIDHLEYREYLGGSPACVAT
jgi:hypothetical protein